MRYAVCGMRYAVCDMRYAVRGTRYAVRGMRYAVCGMQYAVRGMRYAVRGKELRSTAKDAFRGVAPLCDEGILIPITLPPLLGDKREGDRDRCYVIATGVI